MVGYFVAFFWGFAEATLFFFVPDIWISILALQGIRQGLMACLYAFVGALAGGLLMYYLGRADIQTMNKLLNKIPAIRAVDILKVQADLQKKGAIAVLWGPMFGIPYKIYAINAHSVMSITAFILVSLPARLIRFIFVALVTSFASERFLAAFSSVGKLQIVLIVWIVFYAVYFLARRH
jgi:membrane protein YqaA with SNARE-associated domain